MRMPSMTRSMMTRHGGLVIRRPAVRLSDSHHIADAQGTVAKSAVEKFSPNPPVTNKCAEDGNSRVRHKNPRHSAPPPGQAHHETVPARHRPRTQGSDMHPVASDRLGNRDRMPVKPSRSTPMVRNCPRRALGSGSAMTVPAFNCRSYAGRRRRPPHGSTRLPVARLRSRLHRRWHRPGRSGIRRAPGSPEAEIEVPVGSTLLERLRESGIAVESFCETGTCGSAFCSTVVTPAADPNIISAAASTTNRLSMQVGARDDAVQPPLDQRQHRRVLLRRLHPVEHGPHADRTGRPGMGCVFHFVSGLVHRESGHHSDIETFGGTSMSTPIIAGTAALVIEA